MHWKIFILFHNSSLVQISLRSHDWKLCTQHPIIKIVSKFLCYIDKKSFLSEQNCKIGRFFSECTMLIDKYNAICVCLHQRLLTKIKVFPLIYRSPEVKPVLVYMTRRESLREIDKYKEYQKCALLFRLICLFWHAKVEVRERGSRCTPED